MKIAIFTDTYYPQINGVTNTISKLENYFKRNHIEYKIFAPDYNVKEKLTNVETFYSIKLLLYPECRLSMVRSSRVNELLLDYKPDLIHVVTEFNMGWAGMTYALRNNIPSISTYTTNFSQYLKYYKLDMFTKAAWDYMKWFHNQSDLTVCPSNDTKKLLIEKGISNVGIWGRGIDSIKFSPEKRSDSLRKELGVEDKVMLLYVGRVSLEKDLDILFEAYGQIRNEYGDKVSLVVTGDGPMLDKYKSDNKDVIFTGYLKGEALSQLYASSDIFAFPSSSETLGNVVLEAMASEIPVVGVNSGGVKDNIVDGYNGLLSKPQDVKSFKQGIKILIDNEDYRIQIGKNARKFALNKDWDKIFEKLIHQYEEVIYRGKNESEVA